MKNLGKYISIIIAILIPIFGVVFANDLFNKNNEINNGAVSQLLSSSEETATEIIIGMEDVEYTSEKVTAVANNCTITGFTNSFISKIQSKETPISLVFPKYLTQSNGIQITTEIGNGTSSLFLNASSVEQKVVKITFPESLVSINAYAFKKVNANNLKEIVFQNSSDLTKISNYAFQNQSSLNKITTLNSKYNFPGSVTSVGNYAFSGTGLDIIDLSNLTKLRNISSGLFNDCSKLTKVILPNSITKIYDNGFNGCASLTDINLQDCYLENVGNNAFYNCNALQTVTLPSSLKTVGTSVFNCANNVETSIEYIIFEEDCLASSESSIGIGAFNNVKTYYFHKNNAETYNDNGLISLIKSSPRFESLSYYPYEIKYWKADYVGRYEEFTNTSLLTNQLMPFEAVTSVHIPAAPQIEGETFLGWYLGTESTAAKLEEGFIVNKDILPNESSQINLYAKYKTNEYNLKIFNLNYNNGSWTVGDEISSETLLYGTEIDFANDLLLKNAFGYYLDTNLQNLVPTSFTLTRDTTLYLANYTPDIFEFIPLDNMQYVLSAVKNNVSKLIIPNSYNNLPVTFVMANAFYGNESIEFITFESSLSNLKGIDQYAFAELDNLKKVFLPATCENIGARAFYGIENNVEFYLPNKNIDIANSALPAEVTIKIQSADMNDKTTLTSWQTKLFDLNSDITLDSYNEKVVNFNYGIIRNEPAYKNLISNYSVMPYEFFELKEFYAKGYEFNGWKLNGEYLGKQIKLNYKELNNTGSRIFGLNLNEIYKIETKTDGTKKIVGFNEGYENSLTNLEFMETYGGVVVNEIADDAFINDSTIKTVIISKNISYIGENAFKGTSVENVTFETGAGITDYNLDSPRGFVLGVGAFENSNLISIDFTNLTTSKLVVENGAFKNTKITEIDFSVIEFLMKNDSISQNINLNAFAGTEINKITLYNFGSIIWPEENEGKTLTFLSQIIAKEHESVTKTFEVINNVVYSVNVIDLIYIPDALTGDFALPETVETIYDNAFKFTNSLASITLNDNAEITLKYAVINGALYKINTVTNTYLLWHLPNGIAVTEFSVVGKINDVYVTNISDYALRYNKNVKFLKFAPEFVADYYYKGNNSNMLNPNMWANIECLEITNGIKQVSINNFINIPTLKTIYLNVNQNELPTLLDKTDNPLSDYFGENVNAIIVNKNFAGFVKDEWGNTDLISTTLTISLKSSIAVNYSDVNCSLGSVPVFPNVSDEGYDLVGWYYDLAYLKPYTNEGLYSNTTLYAKYVPHEYTVTYMVNGEIFHTEKIEYSKNIKFNETPTVKGYIFNCWVDSDGNEFDLTKGIESDIVLTAKFDRDTSYVTNQILMYASIIAGVVILTVIISVVVHKKKLKKSEKQAKKPKNT